MRLAVGRGAPSGAGFVLECGQDTVWPKPQTVQHKTVVNARYNMATNRGTMLRALLGTSIDHAGDLPRNRARDGGLPIRIWHDAPECFTADVLNRLNLCTDHWPAC